MFHGRSYGRSKEGGRLSQVLLGEEGRRVERRGGVREGVDGKRGKVWGK